MDLPNSGVQETPFNIIYEARPYVNMANCNNFII
jgi:hypothetical protein